jgi:hypothetical protein
VIVSASVLLLLLPLQLYCLCQNVYNATSTTTTVTATALMAITSYSGCLSNDTIDSTGVDAAADTMTMSAYAVQCHVRAAGIYSVFIISDGAGTRSCSCTAQFMQ